MGRGKSFGLIVALTAVIAVFGLVVLRHLFESSLDPITNLSRYDKIKAMWPTDLVRHFPTTPPDSASFYFQPSFLQGGASLQLKVRSTVADIETLISTCSNQMLAAYVGGDMNSHLHLTNGLPTTFFFTSNTDDVIFPNDYTIIVLEAEDRDGDSPWNHGCTAGIAVSTQRQSVVYWAEDW